MDMRFTVETRGVKSQPQFQREFFTNLPKVLGAKPLENYARDTVEIMQLDSPVDTGYNRFQIRWHRVDPYSVSVNAWAPYAGYIDQGTNRMAARPFFSDNALPTANRATIELAGASHNYIQILINKYQRMP